MFLQLEVLLVALKIEGKLTEKIFDGHQAAKPQAFRVEHKSDAGASEILGQFQHLFFEHGQQLLVDGGNPLFQFEGRILVVEVDLVLPLETLLEVDEGVMSCRTQEVRHLPDGLPLLRRIEPQAFLDDHTRVLPEGLTELAPGVATLHL